MLGNGPISSEAVAASGNPTRYFSVSAQTNTTPVPTIKTPHINARSFLTTTTPTPLRVLKTNLFRKPTTTPVPEVVRSVGKNLAVTTTPVPKINRNFPFHILAQAIAYPWVIFRRIYFLIGNRDNVVSLDGDIE